MRRGHAGTGTEDESATEIQAEYAHARGGQIDGRRSKVAEAGEVVAIVCRGYGNDVVGIEAGGIEAEVIIEVDAAARHITIAGRRHEQDVRRLGGRNRVLQVRVEVTQRAPTGIHHTHIGIELGPHHCRIVDRQNGIRRRTCQLRVQEFQRHH